MKIQIRCSLCGMWATHRTSTPFKHLYRCWKGHTTAVPKTAAEQLQDDSPPRARQTDVETSHQAAASMIEAVGAQRARILLALTTGPMTAD